MTDLLQTAALIILGIASIVQSCAIARLSKAVRLTNRSKP